MSLLLAHALERLEERVVSEANFMRHFGDGSSDFGHIDVRNGTNFSSDFVLQFLPRLRVKLNYTICHNVQSHTILKTETMSNAVSITLHISDRKTTTVNFMYRTYEKLNPFRSRRVFGKIARCTSLPTSRIQRVQQTT